MGQRFSRWTVVGFAGTPVTRGGKRCAMWSVRCDCGGEKVVRGSALTGGFSGSCGCLQREAAGARQRMHGHTNGRVRTTEFVIWSGIIQRCEDTGSPAYASYGGRDITICKRWRESFDAFLADVGPRPPGLTLDRHPDKNGNYEPGNVRWATVTEQQNNTRSNRLLEWQGETLNVTQWAQRLSVGRSLIFGRLRAGWPIAQALGFESRKRHPEKEVSQ
jgi:hypothetical protein